MSTGVPELTREEALALALKASMDSAMEEGASWITSSALDDVPGTLTASHTLYCFPYIGTSFRGIEWDCRAGFYTGGKAYCSCVCGGALVPTTKFPVSEEEIDLKVAASPNIKDEVPGS